MSPDSWWTLKILFGAMAGLFALLAGLMTFLDIIKEDDQGSVQEWFRQRWKVMKESRFRDLPERAIGAIVSIKNSYTKNVMDYYDKKWVLKTVVLSCAPLMAIACFLQWGLTAAMIGFAVALPLSLSRAVKFFSNLVTRAPAWLGLLYYPPCLVSIPVLYTAVALQQDIFVASALMVMVLPFSWFYVSVPLAVLVPVFSSVKEDNVFAVGIAVVVSFTVTFLSFLLGHLAEPENWVPQTLQMLVANVVCDAITFLATIYLLSWSLKSRPVIRIPVAICVDIALAAFFAVLSLFAGLVGTEHALSLTQVLNVLIARAPDGTFIEIGPYFWAMHTAFLPTMLYLSVILFGWSGKALLVPVEWFFGKGQAHKSPLKLTAGLFGFMAVTLGIVVSACQAAQEHAERSRKKADITSAPSAASVVWHGSRPCGHDRLNTGPTCTNRS